MNLRDTLGLLRNRKAHSGPQPSRDDAEALGDDGFIDQVRQGALQWVNGRLEQYRRSTDTRGRLAIGVLFLVALSIAVFIQTAVQTSNRHYTRFLIAQSQAIFEDRPLLSLRLLLEGLARARDTETHSAALSALRNISLRGRLLKISSDAEKIYPLNDNSSFILQQRHGHGELHRTTTAHPVLLAGEISSVYFNPDTPFYFIAFKGGGGELRRTDSDHVIPFAGNAEQALFSVQRPFFVGRDANKLADLQKIDHPSAVMRELGRTNGYYIFDPNTQRLVAVYESGAVYLLDVVWLQAVGDDVNALGSEELVRLACSGPLVSTLWTAYDQQDLERMLEGRDPQGCP
jgi:hypothetical protein